jgi:hypothetical protein
MTDIIDKLEFILESFPRPEDTDDTLNETIDEITRLRNMVEAHHTQWLNAQQMIEARDKEIGLLREALQHCVNAIAEYEKDSSESIRPWVLGAMDNAKKVLTHKV